MLKNIIAAIVAFSTRYTWLTIVFYVILAAVSANYASKKFAIDTNINRLISPDLPWRQRELAYEKAFPGRNQLILAVINAPTPEKVSEASRAMAEQLQTNRKNFRSILDLSNSEFFARNGLLFQSDQQVKEAAAGLSQAEPIVSTLTDDMSLRGLTSAMTLALTAVHQKQIRLESMAPVFKTTTDALDGILAGRPTSFSWQALLAGKPSESADLRRFLQIHPVLNYDELEPGKQATDAIRKAAADLDLAGKFGARVRLTGPVPIADEEFATVQEGAVLNGVITGLIVLVILWMALHSGRIIFAVAATIIAGLAMTAAAGLLMVGALNLISIAFAVLFVGLGVDFGIQFSVRYRSERFKHDHLTEALVRSARRAGPPLTLAAAATAAGFLSFLPTDYKGVSELGMIAGAGMMIAYFLSITLLPALLNLLNPKGEKEALGYASMAPVDRFLERHRIGVVVGTLGTAILGLPLLYWLEFDFNPINLRSPQVESIATFLDLRADPLLGANSIDIIAPNLNEARLLAQKLQTLPEVSQARTIEFFVPENQAAKIAELKKAQAKLAPALKSNDPEEPPTDADNVDALKKLARLLGDTATANPGAGAEPAQRLASALGALAAAPAATREIATDVFLTPFRATAAQFERLLDPFAFKIADLPADLSRDWILPDGRARIEVMPKGDPNDNEVLRQFARAVQAVAPSANGGPISILESGRTIVRAFIEAGVWALLSIAILLWIVLKKFTDVLLTLVPLVLAGIVTLEICVLIGMPLNFANIIALPLLLGVGVAFKIYYIMAWRSGKTGLLQSSLTRAVIYSAATTATAFGSLWLSSHPGTSSMGKLMALSLVTTLCAAVLFQPALMGRPRTVHGGDDGATEH